MKTVKNNDAVVGLMVALCVLAAVLGLVCNWGCVTAPALVEDDPSWLGAGPMQVWVDPDMPPGHRAAVDQAVEEIDLACRCRLLLRPLTGAPVLRQEIPGAPDRGTIYVRDDGMFDPRHAHTVPYVIMGRIYSAEIVLPLRGLQPDGLRARELAYGELVRMAVHELGHAVGVRHSRDPMSVFYPASMEGQVLTTADTMGLYWKYGGRL